MKVLFVSHFPLEGSGSGTYTKNLAMQLAGDGHQACVVMPENTSDFPRYPGVDLHPVMFASHMAAGAGPVGEAFSSDAEAHEDGKGFPARESLPFNFPCFTTHPRSTATFGGLDASQIEAYLSAFRSAIAQEVERFDPDLIHGQHIWLLSAVAAEFGLPLVVTAHGTDLMGYDKWLHLRSYADRTLEAAKKLICISRDNENLVLEMFPQHAHKLVRVSNGYNPALFHVAHVDRQQLLAAHGLPYAGQCIVLFAGKLAHFKGVDVLLDAAAEYERELEAVTTLVAGDGKLRMDLEAQAQSLGLKSVHFLGNVSQEELCRFYNAADVSVVPSRREPFGLVAVEAMACGTPVVATEEGGLPDFVNESVGSLVPVEDAHALSQAILNTLARAAAEPQWRSHVAGYAESSYSQAAIMEEVEAIYRSIL